VTMVSKFFGNFKKQSYTKIDSFMKAINSFMFLK
jgi:hypothetical protein